MISSISICLCIRSILLAIFEKKSSFKRFADILYALCFAAAAFAIGMANFHPVPILISAGTIGVAVVLRLGGFLRHSSIVKFGKWFFFTAFWTLSLLSIGLSGFFHLTEDQPIAQVVITGNHQKKWVEWKNPNGALRRERVNASEVVLKSTSGLLIGKYDIYGDFVAVRARVVRFSPILNFLGIPNICHLEAVYNGYETMQRHNQLPHLGYPIPLPMSIFRHLWEKGFYLNWKSSWIKSATLESNYFPLSDNRTFWLTVTEGGLSSA